MKVFKNQIKVIQFLFLMACSTVLLPLLGNNEPQRSENIIPVIFLHKGDSFYLKDSLWQAQQYNKRIILIGDNTNNHYEGVEHYNVSNYFQSARFFGKRKYIHLSERWTSFEWQLLCIQRWFVLRDFMIKHNLDRCFYADSDLMLYCNVSEEKYFDNYDIMLTSKTNGFNGCAAYVTLDGAEKICEGIDYFYSTENFIGWVKWYLSPQRAKGHSVTDMAVLTHGLKWVCKKTGTQLGDLRQVIDEAAFEENIGSHENNTYDMLPINIENKPNKIKKITWINDQPYAFNKKINRLIRLKNLHFASVRKVLMKDYRKSRSSAIDNVTKN